MDDRALIAAAGRGDGAALRELFHRHAPWVAARLRRSLPRDAVEDVLQETFIAVWRGAKGFRAEGPAGAWIWGIARRQAALWLRAHGRSAPAGAPPRPDDPAAAAVARADLQRGFARLGPAGSEARTLARLVFLEGLPVAEVAARLGIPEGTVKSRAYKLRRWLRAALREEEP